MIRYSKGPEPTREGDGGRRVAVLLEIGETPGADWDSFHERAVVRLALGRDQRWVCAYCERRIRDAPADSARPDDDGMKIEHWVARADDANGGGSLQFDWKNLLGVCNGRTPGGKDHCDASRRDRRLFLGPVEGRGADPRVVVRYNDRAEIYAHPADSRVDADVAALNLNDEVLKRRRRAARDALKQRLQRAGYAARAIEAERSRLDAGPRAPEYLEVLRDYLVRHARKHG